MLCSRIPRSLPGIGMQIVQVNVNSIGRVPPHKCEALWSQTIRAGGIGTFVPFDTREVNPVVVRDGIEATSNGSTSGRCRSICVIISRVDICVVVEVLNHIVRNGRSGSFVKELLRTSCMFMIS